MIQHTQLQRWEIERRHLELDTVPPAMVQQVRQRAMNAATTFSKKFKNYCDKNNSEPFFFPLSAMVETLESFSKTEIGRKSTEEKGKGMEGLLFWREEGGDNSSPETN